MTFYYLRLPNITTMAGWQRSRKRHSQHQGQHQPDRVHRVRAWLQPGQGGKHPRPGLQGDGRPPGL